MNDRLKALKWVNAGAEKGWNILLSDKSGGLVAPDGYMDPWDAGFVHHDDIGRLDLTAAGRDELRRLEA